MRRGTTPTLTFTIPEQLNPSDFTVLNIAFAQSGNLIFEKNDQDCIIDGQKITIELLQEDTLKLTDGKSVEIQVRAGIGSLRYASKIIKVPVGRILKEGMI